MTLGLTAPAPGLEAGARGFNSSARIRAPHFPAAHSSKQPRCCALDGAPHVVIRSPSSPGPRALQPRLDLARCPPCLLMAFATSGRGHWTRCPRRLPLAAPRLPQPLDKGHSKTLPKHRGFASEVTSQLTGCLPESGAYISRSYNLYYSTAFQVQPSIKSMPRVRMAALTSLIPCALNRLPLIWQWWAASSGPIPASEQRGQAAPGQEACVAFSLLAGARRFNFIFPLCAGKR